jgi:hypothetical protein
VEFLADVIASKPQPLAIAALDAMRLYRRDSVTRQKILDIVRKRNTAAVSEQFDMVFEEYPRRATNHFMEIVAGKHYLQTTAACSGIAT